jgi:hypothetical protein
VDLRREPALLLISLLAPIVQALTAFLLKADPVTQGIVNTAAVAVAAAAVAVLVRSDKLVPLFTGAAQALIAVAVAFGADWDAAQQALVMVPVSIVAGYLVRDRVTAPVPAVVENSPVVDRTV